MSEKSTTITVREYYRENYILKVAKKECTVSVPGYAGSWVEDVEDVGGMYFIKFQDHEGPHSFNFMPDDSLTVTWLPQADAKPDSGATCAKNAQVEALLPQTIHTVRYGTPEFEQLERDDCEREVSRLRADLASAKAEAGRLRTAACKAEELRQIWLKKSEITDAAYDVLQASDRPYDARTKEYKAHDTLSKESQRALWSFQDAIRNIGNSVWQSYLADQRKQAAALQAGTEGG